MFSSLAKKIFGSVNERFIKSLQTQINQINSFEPSLVNLSDQQLTAKTEEFKDRLANGSTLNDILPEAFAVVREASKRVLKMRHFDVQLIGGIVLHQGKIAEMRTGEGKTLVATLPCYLNALTGQGVHVVTVNDYLAKRDAMWMGKIHNFLNLTVGCITNDLDDEQRKQQYACDITYATNNELGFDYLRDNMKYEIEEMVQRKHNFAIVDEVDSILIDEARTPLIISGPTNDNSKFYQQINHFIPKLESQDYQLEEKDRGVFLTENGIEKIENLLKSDGLIDKDSNLFDPNNISIVHHVNQALKAHKIFKNEIDYIVKENAVVIIDEFTGRMQEGRRFSDGLHQALEAKEGLKVRNENQTLASISFQNYFRLYPKLAGMTGTAMNEAVEFEEIYNLRVVEIPPNRTISRIDEDDEIYKNESGKYQAILQAIKEAHQKKQPILLGTISIEKSEYLSKLLKQNNLPHNVLNAKYHEQEAEIIAQAGIPSAITIATNMAGRGTDIMLGGNPEVMIGQEIDPHKIAMIKAKVEADKKIACEAGGLFVLGCERHESRRIDNQLRGRSGRQGDPGKSKFYLSLEDDLMRIFGSEKLQSLLSTFGLKDDEAIFHPWITKTLAGAQKKVENRNYEIRKNLLKYDDIVNYQRKNIFALRTEVINNQQVDEKISKYITEINEDLVGKSIPKNAYYDQFKIEFLENEVFRIYGIKLAIDDFAKKDGIGSLEILDLIDNEVKKLFEQKISNCDQKIWQQIQKQIFLITIDSEWKDHLLSLDKLRYGINLRAYAQKDPLIEYKKDAFDLFEEMIIRIEEQVVTRLAHVQISLESGDESNEQELMLKKINQLNQQQTKKNLIQTRVDPAFVKSEVKEQKPMLISTITKKKISPEARDVNDPQTWGEVKRNEPCPCNSGKKYKNCHGAN